MITAERLRELLSYDDQSGLFTWLKRPAPRANRIKPGDIAGNKHNCGYIEIGIDGTSYLAHRLAWLYMTGKWPKDQVDHIDGCRANNGFANLRDIPSYGNQENFKRARSDNKTGFLGVTRNGRISFSAGITSQGKALHLGSFPTPEAAHAAYLVAKRIAHKFGTL